MEKTKLTKSAFYYLLLWLLKTSQFSFYNFRSREGLAASGPVWSHGRMQKQNEMVDNFCQALFSPLWIAFWQTGAC